MANQNKKIKLKPDALSVSSEDEFLMIDKSIKLGDDASESGKTCKVTLDKIRQGLFPKVLLLEKKDQRVNLAWWQVQKVNQDQQPKKVKKVLKEVQLKVKKENEVL